MQPYFVGAFVVPVAALILAITFEMAIPQLNESIPAALVRIGWDAAVTALGLCGAIGSEFVHMTAHNAGAVVASINANIGLVEILSLFWAFGCIALLLNIRARNPGYGLGVLSVVIGALALGVPGLQAHLVAGPLFSAVK
jgi:hypothetical protein